MKLGLHINILVCSNKIKIRSSRIKVKASVNFEDAIYHSIAISLLLEVFHPRVFNLISTFNKHRSRNYYLGGFSRLSNFRSFANRCKFLKK